MIGNDNLTLATHLAAREARQYGLGVVQEPPVVSDEEADLLCQGNLYAAKVCDDLPDAATRNGWTVSVKDKGIDEADPFADPMDTLFVRQRILRACGLARRHGDAALYLSIDDGQEPDQPVNLRAIRRVRQLQLIERWQLEPVRWELDIDAPGFGEPVLWRFTPQIAGAGPQLTTGMLIHVDRLLLFRGVWLPQRLRQRNANRNDSVLRRPWHEVIGLSEVDRDVRAILHSFSLLGYGAENLPDMTTAQAPDQLAKRLAALRMGMDAFGMISYQKGAEEIVALQRTVAGLVELYDRCAQVVATAAGQSIAQFFGQAPGGLSTDDESGNRNWSARVKAYQEGEIQPQLERLVRYLALSSEGPTGGREPEEWRITFAPLDEPTEGEMVDARLKVAQADATYITSGVYDPVTVAETRAQPNGHLLPIPLIEMETPPDADPGEPADDDPPPPQA